MVVLGHTVYQQLFGAHEDPLGATILVKGFPLRVIGVLAAKGQSGWGPASLTLAQDAYAAGRGSWLQVLDAQRLYAQALLGYARAKGQRYLDTVQLFQAMGGAGREWSRQAAVSTVEDRGLPASGAAPRLPPG